MIDPDCIKCHHGDRWDPVPSPCKEHWDIRLKNFGWAPGTYFCKCFRCERTHVADKRAMICYVCANTAFWESMKENLV